MGKKIIISAVSIVAVSALSFGYLSYSSNNVETQFKEFFAAPAAECIPGFISSKLDDYKRGMMTSTAVTSHWLRQLPGIVRPLLIDHEISHSSLFGAFTVTSRIRVPDDQAKTIKEYLNLDIPPIKTTVHSKDRYEGSWVIPDINDLPVPKHEGKTLTINGLKLNFAQAETFIANLSLEKSLTNEPKDSVLLSEMSYEFNRKGNLLCPVQLNQQGAFKLANLFHKDKESGKDGELKNLTGGSTITEEGDNLAIKTRFGFDKFTMDGHTVDNAEYEVSLNNISKTGYLNIKEGLLQIPMLIALSKQIPPSVIDMLRELVKNSPSLEINKLAFTTDMPEFKGSFSAASKLTFNPNEYKSPSLELDKLAFTIDMSKPKVIKGALSATAKITVDTDGFNIKQIKPKMDIVDILKIVDNVKRHIVQHTRFEGQGEVSKSFFANAPFKDKLQDWIKEGFINEENDLYKSKASFDFAKNVFLINDKPISPPPFYESTF